MPSFKDRSGHMIKKILVLSLSLSLLFYVGCDKKSSVDPQEPDDSIRGQIISTTPVNTYTADEIKQLLPGISLYPNFQLKYNVEALRIVYQTVNAHGEVVQASGALMVPVGADTIPILSIQHGTETLRESVASVNPSNSPEGYLGLLAASMGYLTTLPDYLGFGVSEVLHPYVHGKSNAITVIDLLRAVKSYSSENNIISNGQLFLAGYSEGGYVTLATHKEIEQKYATEFQLTAVAPMAGPYDMLSTAVTLMGQTEYKWPYYLAFFITAYNDIYGWNRLTEIFNSPYGSMMTYLFDGTKSSSEINNSLSTKISELLNQDFVTKFLNGEETEIIAALQENNLLNWAPQARIRFYHGDADDAVPYQNALTAVDSLRAMGGNNIELVTIPNGTHESASLPSIIGMLGWFEEF